MAHAGSARDRQSGSVTVEFAVALPALVMALVLVVLLIQLGANRLAVERAAGAGARAAAIGVLDEVPEVVRRIAGAAASSTTTQAGGWVTVEVTKPVIGAWGTWQIMASYRVPTEDYLVGIDLGPASTSTSRPELGDERAEP